MVNIQSGNLTGDSMSGSMYSYQLGNATITGTGITSLEIQVNTGYITLDAAAPTGGQFHAGFDGSTGTVYNSHTSNSNQYTDVQFRPTGATTFTAADLQAYLRNRVTFSTTTKQTVTVTAEQMENMTVTVGGTQYPVEPFMGHYYTYVQSSTYGWSDAYKAAKSMKFNGLTGYLLTITSEAEHYYIYQKFGKAGWMGATRAKGNYSADANDYSYSSDDSREWY